MRVINTGLSCLRKQSALGSILTEERTTEEIRYWLEAGDMGSQSCLVPPWSLRESCVCGGVVSPAMGSQDSPAMMALVVKKTWLTGTTVVVV